MDEHQANPLLALSGALADLVDAAGRSAVAVHGAERRTQSGFVWRPGVVVTAEETLERDEGLELTLADGRRAPATLAGRDPGTDIAVLRAELPDMAPLAAGGLDSLRTGALALSVGRGPDGVLAALGIVSAIGPAWRSRRGGEIDRRLGLDLALAPQGEGGPLVDMQGRLIGMAVLGPRRRTLAIPAGTIDRVAAQLLERGRVARGYLGLGLQPVRLDDAAARVLPKPASVGLIVVSVDPGGPGRTAGLMLGDVIAAWDGAPVEGMREVMRRLGPSSVGRQVALTVLRAGAVVEASLAIGERPGA